MEIFIVLFVFLYSSLVHCSNNLFQNPVYNEASIFDFIENDPFFEILYPESLQYTYRLRQAKNFGTSFTRTHYGMRLVVTDPENSCSKLYNSALVSGAIALATRGGCSFVSKALQAEDAGALAIIVTETDVDNDSSFIEMITDGTERNPSIPAYFLLGRNGNIIKDTLLRDRVQEAIINIPVNLTNVPIHKLNQPPWIVW